MSQYNSSETVINDGIQENKTNAPPPYFSLLFYGLIIWGLAFSAYFIFSGWSSHAEFKDKMVAHQEKVQKSMTALGAK